VKFRKSGLKSEDRGNDMGKRSETETPGKERLFSGILWLNAKAMGLALGLICALIIFIATNWLVLKGGNPVGPNLQLLSQYFIGYRVSFMGSLIGSAYGFALGTLCGALIGWLYNKVAYLRSKS
jgi:ABC-type dipeptide/oligopeptide/nickel transport system permease subunit